jgi:hypothetical protein
MTDAELEERKTWLEAWAKDLQDTDPKDRKDREERAHTLRALCLEIGMISSEQWRRKNRTIKDKFEEIMKIERAATPD